jgi:tRNA(Ile)-lysidine synthase
MNSFVRNLLTEWRRLSLPLADETFVVAVSGGADSLALALALRELKRREKLNLRFVIAHFNHNLRGAESDADEKFVRDLAVEYDFELAIGRADILENGNLEQSARIARYDFLTNVAENLHAYGALTAHTVNDQAETFLLNLIRGSGIEGLSGMKPVRVLRENYREMQSLGIESAAPNPRAEFNPLKSQIPNQKSEIFLVRPLLHWANRRDTENFCHENAVEYRYDSMNEDLAFKRVRIRRVLLPLLQDFNPQIIERLAATAALLRDEREELEKLAIEHLNAADKEDLKIKDLVDLSSPLRRRVLRGWLAAKRGDLRALDLRHLEAIERLIFSRRSGKTVELPGGESIVKTMGNLSFKNKG